MDRILFSGMIFSSLLLFAAEDGVIRKGSMKITIPWNERISIPAVKVDSSNIRIEMNRADLTVRPPAGGSFGAALGLPDRRILWTPALKRGSLSRTRVLESVQTEDFSTILFAEETGDPEGPFGTRIIAYDPANLRCFRITELSFQARSIAPCGNTGEIVCVRIPQRDLKDRLSLVKVNLRSGKIRTLVPLEEKPAGLYADASFVFIRKKDGTFHQFSGGKFRSRPIPADAGQVIFRKGILTAVTPQGISFYDAAEEEIRESIPLPGIRKAFPLGSGSFYALVKKENSVESTLMFYSGKQFRILVRECGDDFYPSADGKGLFLRQRPGKEHLVRLELKKYTLSRNNCNPSELRPRTAGVIKQMFPSPLGEELLCIPVIRRPFLIRYEKRQWKKILDE